MRIPSIIIKNCHEIGKIISKCRNIAIILPEGTRKISLISNRPNFFIEPDYSIAITLESGRQLTVPLDENFKYPRIMNGEYHMETDDVGSITETWTMPVGKSRVIYTTSSGKISVSPRYIVTQYLRKGLMYAVIIAIALAISCLKILSPLIMWFKKY